MPYEGRDKTLIARALRRLGELAFETGTVLEISLYGGAVFTVVYGSRTSTKEIDAIVRPSDLAEKLAARVAHELQLPEDWLNDDVRYFLAGKEAKRTLSENEFGPGLQVSVPTAAYLLAIKLRACRAPLPGRAGDHEDIEFLVRKMEIPSLADAEKIHNRFFPEDVLSEDARDVVRKAILGNKGL